VLPMPTPFRERIEAAADAALSRLAAALRWSIDSYAIFVIVGVAVGLALAPAAADVAASPDGTVAVVHIDGTIDGAQSAQYSAMMAEARAEADAVVVVANSGGGSAPASEEMYLQTKRTSEEIPVVASVDGAAASGAYYAIAPAERIYVKPASVVGSVGVLAPIPPSVEPNDVLGTTGPNKLTGGDDRQFYYDLTTLQQAFLGAVFAQRGDRIALTRSEVGHAGTYVGVTAVEHGLADEVGSRERAIRFAAAEAGLENPEVRVLRPDDEGATFMLRSTYLASEADDREMSGVDPLTEDAAGPPTYLMVPRSVFAGTDAQAVSAAEVAAARDAAANGTATDAEATGTGDDGETAEDPAPNGTATPTGTATDDTADRITPLVAEVTR